MVGRPAEIQRVAMQQIKYVHKALQDSDSNNKQALSLDWLQGCSFALISSDSASTESATF